MFSLVLPVSTCPHDKIKFLTSQVDVFHPGICTRNLVNILGFYLKKKKEKRKKLSSDEF